MAKNIRVGAHSCVVDSGVEGTGYPTLPSAGPGRIPMADPPRFAGVA